MKKKLSILLVLLSLFLVGCGNRVDETTMFYSMVTSPSEYYIRLEKDGDFYNNAGLSGTYELKDDKVTFYDEIGSVSEGYILEDKYLLYVSYKGFEDLIPDDEKFDVVVFDGLRTTITFKSDGTMEKYIYQENVYNYQLIGSYERNGDLITCTYGTKSGETTTQVYAVHDGVLYEVLSSDKSDFTETQIASMDKLVLKPEEEVNVLAVVMVAIGVVVIIAIVFLLIRVISKNNNKDAISKNNNMK